MNLSIDRFTYNPATRMLVAEASDLGCRAGQRPFHQIYADACDEGITVVNRQGIDVSYYLDEEKRDAAGDLQVWILKPTPESIRRAPESAGTTVHILNE